MTHGPGAACRLRATSSAAPAIMIAAMTSRRSTRSDSAPIGKTPSAEPTTIAEVNCGAVSGDMPIPTAKIGPSEIDAPFAAPAANAAAQEMGAKRTSHKSRGRMAPGWAGGSTLVIAIGTMASASSAPATAKEEKPSGPSGFKANCPLAEAAKLAIW